MLRIPYLHSTEEGPGAEQTTDRVLGRSTRSRYNQARLPSARSFTHNRRGKRHRSPTYARGVHTKHPPIPNCRYPRCTTSEFASVATSTASTLSSKRKTHFWYGVAMRLSVYELATLVENQTKCWAIKHKVVWWVLRSADAICIRLYETRVSKSTLMSFALDRIHRDSRYKHQPRVYIGQLAQIRRRTALLAHVTKFSMSKFPRPISRDWFRENVAISLSNNFWILNSVSVQGQPAHCTYIDTWLLNEKWELSHC